MRTWTADRLPITVEPLPGEALDSWIAAYARRLHTTSNGLIDHLGLGGTRITQMTLRFHKHEAVVLERATGVGGHTLTAMTLEPYDGLAIATQPGHRGLLARFPAGRFGTARARYCPACLRQNDGRGPITWRLPWSFACPRHHLLLLDFCPHCRRPPRPWNTRRLGPRTGGACTRDTPDLPADSGRRRGACGADLTHAPTITLRPDGLILTAHRHLADLMTSPPGDWPTALTALREIYAVAGRALRGLNAVPGQAPQIVHTVLEEVRAELPDLAGADVGRGTRSAAVGAALAYVALDDTQPDHEALFDWILRADRSLLPERQYKPSIGVLAGRWAWCGPDMVSRVLGRLDGQVSLHARLRYASAHPRPRWPDLPADVIARRAAMIPAMLWPGWTMRLLPVPDHSTARPADPRTSAFRRGCASFLLLPGGPPQLNFERAGPLVGNQQTNTDRDAVERRIYRHHDLTPLASTLAQLAFALDEHGSPIDYARRRALFTDSTLTLDLDAYTRLRLQHGWSKVHAPRAAVLRWYLRMLLTGEHPVSDDAKKPFGRHCTDFRFRAPGPLRVFLRQQAQANLVRHGITEPVTWEPPANWVTRPGRPGIDPVSVPTVDFTALLTTGTVHDAADALTLTPEHIRLYCEATDTGTPTPTPNGTPRPQNRVDMLNSAQLRDLYEHQNRPMAEIARMAGCATATIRWLLEHDGVPHRRTYRRPPPKSAITREWLEHEYVNKLRSISALGRERGVTANYLMRLARNWDLPIRNPSHYSGIGHLNLPSPLSPAIRAVTMPPGALNRLELITHIPGHPSIAAAARAIYDGRDSALRQQVTKLEKAAGFTIIDRSTTPLTPTPQGHIFLDQALYILQIAKESRVEASPRVLEDPPAPLAVAHHTKHTLSMSSQRRS